MSTSNAKKQVVKVDRSLNKYQGMPMPKWKVEIAKVALPEAAEAIRIIKEKTPKSDA